MIIVNKQTRIFYLLLILLLVLVIGYSNKVLIFCKYDSSTNLTNLNTTPPKMVLNNPHQPLKNKESPSRISCETVKIKLTKMISLGPSVEIEGITTPGARVVINGEVKVKADSKGVFKAFYTQKRKQDVFEAFDPEGSVGKLIILND